MTLESTGYVNKYIGNGTTTEYPFTFKVWNKDQVRVFVGDGETETDKSGGCTIEITDTGGTVAFSVAPASGQRITIRRGMPFTQEDDYRNGSRFDAEEVEDRFDQDCAERQELLYNLNRAVLVPETSEKSGTDVLHDMLDAKHEALNAAGQARSAEQWLHDFVADVPEGDVSLNNVTSWNTSQSRSLAERCADIINIKDFGAKGDGVTNDTSAWTAWQTALQSGGIGYVPAGHYLVNGSVRHFISGCFGNGINWQMTGDNVPDDSFFMSNITETGPIIQYHRDFNGIESWSPLIDLSFDSVSDREWPWTTNGAGAQGIQVRGTIKGVGNSHPNGVRSLMLNELNGDGDCVAIWGRCHKHDPAGGTNNSDTCGIHAMCEMSGTGLGICMASEHWAECKKTQGAAGTNYSSFFDEGGIVCQHIMPIGTSGMVQSCLLFNHGGGDYGAWSAININNNVCKYNGSTQYPADTCFIKSPNMHPNACPEAFEFLGWCPKHVKMSAGYDYNISANIVKKFNNLPDNDSFIAVIDQRYSTSSESNAPKTGILFVGQTYGGTPHAPNVGSQQTLFFDLYSERNNPNIFYRALNQNTTHHAFYATDASANLGEVFNIFYTAVRPGRDNAQQLGDSSKRWSVVFAGTGTINTSDERVKDNIEAPNEALMRAWGKVNFKVFQMRDAIAEKGAGAARLHVGVIAQHVISAFAEEGLDATRYGMLCHDEWEAEEPKIQHRWIVDEMEKRDDDGNTIEKEKGHYEDFVENPGRQAGDLYSIRYDEALALECAYQRWRLEQIENRLNGGQ